MLKSLDNLSLNGMEEKVIQDDMVNMMENDLNTIIDGIHQNSLPNSNTDSRKLLDNKIITKLNIDQQKILYINLISLVQEAIYDTERQTDDEINKIYNKGVRCALNEILYDLNKKCDLYYLGSKYKKIIPALIVLFEEFADVEENNFQQTKIKGMLAGYTNFIEILEDRIQKEENSIFRQENLQNVR